MEDMEENCQQIQTPSNEEEIGKEMATQTTTILDSAWKQEWVAIEKLTHDEEKLQ